MLFIFLRLFLDLFSVSFIKLLTQNKEIIKKEVIITRFAFKIMVIELD